MSQRHVIILSTRGLYREGLKRLLADVAIVVLATSIEEVEELVGRKPVDTVILDQEDRSTSDDDFVCQLLSEPNIRVITVGLDVRDTHIYRHRHVAQASPETLIAAIVY